MKTFHSIGGKSAMVGYKILRSGSHVVQQGHETISLGFAVKTSAGFCMGFYRP